MADIGEFLDIEEGFDAGEWNNPPCPKCQGTGFSGRGTMYDDVCDECGGLRYLPSAVEPLFTAQQIEPDLATPAPSSPLSETRDHD